MLVVPYENEKPLLNTVQQINQLISHGERQILKQMALGLSLETSCMEPPTPLICQGFV